MQTTVVSTSLIRFEPPPLLLLLLLLLANRSACLLANRSVCLLTLTVSGTLDVDEVQQLARELAGVKGSDGSPEQLSNAELAAAMDEMGRDENGSVDFEKFWAWWQDRLAGKQSKSSVFSKAFQSKSLTGKDVWDWCETRRGKPLPPKVTAIGRTSPVAGLALAEPFLLWM
jgi:hypothetical protein